MEPIDEKVIKSGTTTLGLVCKDGVVLAADKRATAGYPPIISSRDVEKVFPITDNIAVTIAGNVSDIQLVIKMVKAELRLKKIRTKKEPTVKEISSLLTMISYENIRKFSPLMAITAFLVGGKDKKGFWLYEVSPDGCLVERKNYASDGSGSVMAFGVLEDSYKEGLTTKEGIRLAVRAISAAMKRDTCSGSGIDVVVIDEKGARKVLSEEVKEVLVKKTL
ncbi:MAG: proteasome subunit beta [archaeon]|nr:MAG: proteasome subunit beta [archaeon]